MSSPPIPRRRTPLARSLHAPAAPARPPAVPEPPGTRPAAGRYRYDLRTGAWWWSPEMFAVLAVCPDLAPSTELLVAGRHPADGPRILDALDGARAGAAFALLVRAPLPDGVERLLALIGEPQHAAGGEPVAVEGICADVTEGRPPGADEERLAALRTEVLQLRTAMASRAGIEQAKGILMLLTNCGDQAAFELLAHISSHTHRKVREVAQTIVESATGRSALPDDIAAIVRDACPPAGHPG